MTLTTQTLLLALCMGGLGLLPLLSGRVHRHSTALFLMGTGAMFGICFFDLVPEVFALGGWRALFVSAGVWALYSVGHLLHFFHHVHDPDSHEDTGRAFWFFMIPLALHGFASGMLLAVSQQLSGHAEVTVFAALLAHKAYESLLLSSILIAQKSRGFVWKLQMVLLYASALPAGVLITTVFRSDITHGAAVMVSSVAVGTLLGCLIFDFLLPSLEHIRDNRYRVAWALAGFTMTQFVMSRV